VLAGAVLLAVALLIGISRVRIGAHYPTDVVAGWMLGLTVLLLIVGR
jgi:undecaprenyl-diphosphatase